jgi:hypothetical protein
MIAVAGELEDSQIGGPSADIAGDSPSQRRTLYAFIDRQNFPGLFRAFDVATPDAHAPQRFETTVPQQSLYLMNHPFTQDIATKAAARAIGNSSVTLKSGIERIFSQILGRMPTSNEIDLATQLFLFGDAERPSEIPTDNPAWGQLAHVLIMSNEFAFLD